MLKNVKSIEQAVQRDMLAYIPVCADSSYPSVPSIDKGARNLPALKWRGLKLSLAGITSSEPKEQEPDISSQDKG